MNLDRNGTCSSACSSLLPLLLSPGCSQGCFSHFFPHFSMQGFLPSTPSSVWCPRGINRIAHWLRHALWHEASPASPASNFWAQRPNTVTEKSSKVQWFWAAFAFPQVITYHCSVCHYTGAWGISDASYQYSLINRMKHKSYLGTDGSDRGPQECRFLTGNYEFRVSNIT